MITVYTDDQSFIYDIHSLFKAFYPREEISVSDDEGVAATADCIIRVGEDEVVLTYGDTGSSFPVRGLPRKEIKNRIKLLVYDVLSNITGHTLPWGTLTGVRPTKIAFGMLESGSTSQDIAEYMKRTYKTGDEKIDLAVGIAAREREILKSIEDPKGYSLYIGIPFCPSICLYCSFASSPIGLWQERVDAYLDALIKEIEATAEMFADRVLSTIYIGGGTPTSLSAVQLDRLLNAVDSSFDVKSIFEYTVEAGRPDSVDEEKLAVIRSHGVDRVSINPQTMNQKTLDLIGRHHSVEDIYRAYEQARAAGFKSINMDIITGLPDEGIPEVERTANEIIRLAPDDLTVHSLAIKRSSRLRIEWDRYRDAAFNNSAQIMEIIDQAAKQLDMQPYYMYRQKNIAANLENIGYATKGHEGLYNILIMEERQDIVALGAGADSKRIARAGEDYDHVKKVERCENVKDVEAYMSRLDEMIGRKRALFFDR